MNLSVIILTKNEEKSIPACIKGARFADEIRFCCTEKFWT